MQAAPAMRRASASLSATKVSRTMAVFAPNATCRPASVAAS
jgi:hypothetical protein